MSKRLQPRPNYGGWGVSRRRRYAKAAFLCLLLIGAVAATIYLLTAF
jgi:hypothetical protein